jgi:hypothetical protein
MKRTNMVTTTHMAPDADVNRLLGLLSSKDYRRLQPQLRRVPLATGSRLAGRASGSAPFVLIVGSLVNTVANGQEVGTPGR